MNSVAETKIFPETRLGGMQVSSSMEKAGVCELGGEVLNMGNWAWWRQTGCRAALPGQTRCGHQAQQPAERGLGLHSPWQAWPLQQEARRGFCLGFLQFQSSLLFASVPLIAQLALTSSLVPGFLPDFSFLIGGWL